MIHLLCVGKLKSDHPLHPVVLEYLKRCRRWQSVTLTELTESPYPDATQAQRDDYQRMAPYLAKAARVLLFTERGALRSSPDWANWLRLCLDEGGFSATRPWVWVIAGPTGVGAELAHRADDQASLSRMTFPHLLARVLVAEQLYRALCIQNRVPYHK